MTRRRLTCPPHGYPLCKCSRANCFRFVCMILGLWSGLGVGPDLRQPFLDEMTAVYGEVRVVLDGRQRRLLLGAVAQRLGRSGIKPVAAAVGVDRDTVSQGAQDVAVRPVTGGA